MAGVDKEYLDAKFEGLEKLMASQERNLNGYIGAVSASVRDVRRDLKEHAESADAHGVGASNRGAGNIIQWLSLVVSLVALCALIIPLLHK